MGYNEFSNIHSLKTFLYCYSNRSRIYIDKQSYVGRYVDIRVTNGASLKIGKNSKIDDNVRIVVTNSSCLEIGDAVKIGKGSVLNCGDNCSIGESTLVSGYCYIQCSSHKMNSDKKIRSQGHIHQPITIGEDCMIGSHSFISPGTVMEKDQFGTHSLVGCPFSILYICRNTNKIH